jgi:divalent metal cation (Fe/Co/Zn/Cd) transporter
LEIAVPADFSERPVRAAYRVSIVSVAYSFVSSSVAIVLGLGASIVLVAFGAIGLVDMLGSIALTFHFRHALHHEAMHVRAERVVHRVVRSGMFVVGVATLAVSAVRLATGAEGSAPVGGSALAAVSVVVLAVLSTRKIRLGREVASRALVVDGRVSGVGAVQAAIALLGLAATRWFDAGWADAAAAMVVGAAAALLAVFDPE